MTQKNVINVKKRHKTMTVVKTLIELKEKNIEKFNWA